MPKIFREPEDVWRTVVWEATAVLLIFLVDWGERENNIVCFWSVQENRVEGNWCADYAQGLRKITRDQLEKEESHQDRDPCHSKYLLVK